MSAVGSRYIGRQLILLKVSLLSLIYPFTVQNDITIAPDLYQNAEVGLTQRHKHDNCRNTKCKRKATFLAETRDASKDRAQKVADHRSNVDGSIEPGKVAPHLALLLG
jgi:hypothetical protein